jgi:hypothetical protein
MIKNCKHCNTEFVSGLNMNPYCTNLCRSRDKFIIINSGSKPFRVWKKNYEKYPEFYNSISYKERLKNKCFMCESEFEKFSMCCSIKCSDLMKKQSTLLSTGAEHNLSNNSKARKNMIQSLNEKYGVDNVFSREDVILKLKDTWVKKYGYTNPSKVDYIKNKKRQTSEINGFWCPKERMNHRMIYEENVYNITWHQMKKFACLKFGSDIWERMKESKKLDQREWLTVDHRYSRSKGFIDSVSPEIIGHICNLEIIKFYDNRKKSSNCSVDLNTLISEIQEFDKKIYKL